MDFIDPLVPAFIKNLPTHMDFDGQLKAERFFQYIICLFAVVGFVWGYASQSFSQTLYILFAGVFLSSVLTLVPWPMYRSKPLNWQPARPEGQEIKQTQGSAVSGVQTKSKKKKIKE